MSNERIHTSEKPALLWIMLRWLGYGVLGLLGIAAAIYVGDCAGFYLRGKPADQVTVSRYLSAPLKGHKTELYFEGTQPMPCARALFPQAGMNPCWYVRRHPIYAESL
jgi:hypothetical protein